MKISFNVVGLRETVEAMQDLRKSTNERAMREALRAGGEITAQAARAIAPVDTGGLREGINVSAQLSSRQRKMHTKRAEVEMFVGPAGGPKAIVQEFGSVDQPPQPYMRPAWDATHREVLARIADEVMVRVQKATDRARKKAAPKS